MGRDDKNNRRVIEQAKRWQKFADTTHLQIYIVNHDHDHRIFRERPSGLRYTCREFDDVFDEVVPLAIEVLPIPDLLFPVENLLDETCPLRNPRPSHGGYTEELMPTVQQRIAPRFRATLSCYAKCLRSDLRGVAMLG